MAGDLRRIVFTAAAAACAVVTGFFGVYGVLVIYTAATDDGEGSLGHVGLYIAALLFPLLAVLFGGFTYLAWRARQRPVPRRGSA